MLEVHNMDIYICCFLAGIYVCEQTYFQKFKSLNDLYVRARQIMPVTERPVALRRS